MKGLRSKFLWFYHIMGSLPNIWCNGCCVCNTRYIFIIAEIRKECIELQNFVKIIKFYRRFWTIFTLCIINRYKRREYITSRHQLIGWSDDLKMPIIDSIISSIRLQKQLFKSIRSNVSQFSRKHTNEIKCKSTNTPRLSEIATWSTEYMTHIRGSSITIVSEYHNNHRDASCRVSFIDHLDDLACIFVFATSARNSSIDIVIWNILFACFCNRLEECRIRRWIIPTASCKRDKLRMKGEYFCSRLTINFFLMSNCWTSSHSKVVNYLKWEHNYISCLLFVDRKWGNFADLHFFL